MSADRKTSFKLPPTTNQETRRNRALEEQKRRRAQKVDSSRQLDLFAGLNLGGSDDDDPEDDSVKLATASVAQYAALLHQDTPNAISSFHHVPPPPTVHFNPTPSDHATTSVPSKKRRKPKRKSNKPSKWADKCMYAELLEMIPDHQHWMHTMSEHAVHDGLPRDLETAWVALAPVPVGKRCLAVTHQSAGVVGVSPNTTLRSRLLGKTLIQRFPSSLPPLTILDCILDANWRDNGILHVLDVIKWKGQDVADCEARFRFWWRDTRLQELATSLPPTSIAHPNFVPINETDPQTLKYNFPYPTTFAPVPWHTDTSLLNLEREIVPAAQRIRDLVVSVPLPWHIPQNSPVKAEGDGDRAMDVEPLPSGLPAAPYQFSFGTAALAPPAPPSLTIAAKMDAEQIYSTPYSNSNNPNSNSNGTNTTLNHTNTNGSLPEMTTHTAHIEPDGLLLYVAEASYEPGTSPLSSWVPIVGYEENQKRPLELFKTLVGRRLARSGFGFGAIQESGDGDGEDGMDM